MTLAWLIEAVEKESETTENEPLPMYAPVPQPPPEPQKEEKKDDGGTVIVVPI